jgi:drug/metabolite transporter (DMT)-like permease
MKTRNTVHVLKPILFAGFLIGSIVGGFTIILLGLANPVNWSIATAVLAANFTLVALEKLRNYFFPPNQRPHLRTIIVILILLLITWGVWFTAEWAAFNLLIKTPTHDHNSNSPSVVML